MGYIIINAFIAGMFFTGLVDCIMHKNVKGSVVNAFVLICNVLMIIYQYNKLT